MFFIIYKITNSINGKIYIGMHKTKNLDDGYMGSGKVIKRAIRKYGLDNFSKTILFTCESEQDMIKKEAEIVDFDFCLRKDTYNICVGGKGGFGYINDNGLSVRNLTKKNAKERSELAKIAKKILASSSEEWVKRYAKNQSEAKKRHYQENGSHWSGKKHTEETKKLMSMSGMGKRKGSKNGQFGKMWITNGNESIRILRNEEIPEGWKKGRVIKRSA